MKHHYAHIEKSKRLRRVFFVLVDGKPKTTIQIQNEAGVAAAGAACTEVRENLKRKDLPPDFQGYRLKKSRRIKTVDGYAFVYVLERVVPTGEGVAPPVTTGPPSPPPNGRGQLKLL